MLTSSTVALKLTSLPFSFLVQSIVWTDAWYDKDMECFTTSNTTMPSVDTETARNNAGLRKIPMEMVQVKWDGLLSDWAVPEYESCMPVSKTIAHREDTTILDFIPYADNATFNVTKYASQFSAFRWQMPGGTGNPDRELFHC